MPIAFRVVGCGDFEEHRMHFKLLSHLNKNPNIESKRSMIDCMTFPSIPNKKIERKEKKKREKEREGKRIRKKDSHAC
jgi:hypothetical protein